MASFGRQEIPAGLIENGEIKKEEELIEVIKRAIKGVKGEVLRTPFCVASLPETESYVRVVQLPAIKKEEITEAIKWEIEASVPLSLNEIYYDWQIIEPAATINKTTDKLNVLIGVLPKKTVDPYLNVLKKAGLKPIVLEIESIAVAQALVKENEKTEPMIIIDLGAQRTNLVIFFGQTIYLTTNLPISNNLLIDNLSEKLKISREKAKQIKLKIGLDYHHPQSRVFKEMAVPLEDTANKIKSYIDFYQEHILKAKTADQKINRILLCGGGANLAGLTEFLSSKLKMTVAIGNPWINICEEPPSNISAGESLAYTTALGLALRSCKDDCA